MMLRKLQYFIFLLLTTMAQLAHGVVINELESTLQVIRIAIANDGAPYSFIDNKGRANGLLVDYWRLWATKVNKDIELVPFALADALQALKNNQVELHIGLLGQKKHILMEMRPSRFIKPRREFTFGKNHR